MAADVRCIPQPSDPATEIIEAIRGGFHVRREGGDWGPAITGGARAAIETDKCFVRFRRSEIRRGKPGHGGAADGNDHEPCELHRVVRIEFPD